MLEHEEMQSNQEEKKILNHLSTPYSLLGIGIGFFALSILASIYLVIIALFFKGKDLNNEAISSSLYALVYFFAYGSTAILLILILKLPTLKKIFRKWKNIDSFGKGILYGVVLLFSTAFFSIIIKVLCPEVGNNVNESQLETIMKHSPFLSFFFIVIFAPFTEELTYRYCLFGEIYKKKRWIAYLVCGLIFGFIHFDFTGIFQKTAQEALNEWLNLPIYIFSGLFLCFVYEKEDNLICPIVAHLVNNLYAFTMTIIASNMGDQISSISSMIFIPF